MVKILGYGSLLSEQSARSTFGATLSNFRLARVKGYRRVFALPGSMFFREGIAYLETKESTYTREIGGLLVEPYLNSEFVVSVFDIPDDQLPAFHARESLYNIAEVPYYEMTGNVGKALMCLSSTDEQLIQKKGQAYFDERYGIHGLHTVWGWDHESGILPCRVYLRHCVLSAKKLGEDVYKDFLEHSYIGDRKTTIKEYLAIHPDVMDSMPPQSLIGRYSG